MEIKTQAKFYKKKKLNSLYISLLFVLFVLILTIWLYLYNINITKAITKIDSSISTVQSSINELEKDKRIIIAKIYKANKSSMGKLEDYSNITTFIKHLYYIRRKYYIDFKWFKINNWKLNTNIVAVSDSLWINYKKVYKFLSKYNNDDNSLFNLWFVKTIVSKNNWVNDEFQLNMTLKNNYRPLIKKINKVKQEKNRKTQEKKRKILQERLNHQNNN